MNNKNSKIRVGISIGDFNGISPEIIMKSLNHKNICDFFTPVIFGSGKLFTYQKNIFKLNLNFNYINYANQILDGKLNMFNLSRENIKVELGHPTEESTQMAIDSLNAATQALIKGEIDVLVTAPINKDEMLKHGFKHAGHTGFFEEKFNQKGLMILCTDELKVAALTHHIPLKEVSEAVTKEKIIEKVKILNQSLIQDFCIQKPKIAILGLNPHAGDNGSIGKEEIETIIPAIEILQNENILAFGPYPADSFFQPKNMETFDAVLAMYHDQGLIPFKTLFYEKGVNFTAGLPFIRTSPDHGTAYNIAGKNKADAQSFTEAIFTAIEIFKNRKEYEFLTSNRLKSTKIKDSEIDEDLPEE